MDIQNHPKFSIEQLDNILTLADMYKTEANDVLTKAALGITSSVTTNAFTKLMGKQ